MPTEKTWRLILGGGLALFVGWLSLRYLLPAALPVLLGAGLGIWFRRMGRRLSAHTGIVGVAAMGEKGCGLVLGGLFCLIVPLLLYRGALVLAGQAGSLVEQAASLWRWEVLPGWLVDYVPASVREQVGSFVRSAVERGAGWLAGVAGGLLQSLPGAALSLFIGVVSLFYWVGDGEGILTSLRTLMPVSLRTYLHSHPWREPAVRFLRKGIRSIGTYLRAQVSIGAVVCLVLTAGLSLLSVPSPIAWALLIALVDVLPFLGAAVVLVPWAAFAFFGHRTVLGVSLVVLTVLVWLVRQLLEPRMLGKAMGVHAWVMLAGLFVAYRLAGVKGMLGCAVLLGCKTEE